MQNLSGKVAIVTGASGGIGRAAALEFANQGANIVVHYMSKATEAKSVADQIETMGQRAILAQVDFRNMNQASAEVKAMVNRAVQEFGRVDVLLNLAGYPARGEWNKRLVELTSEDFFKPLNVDLYGSFLSAQAVAPHFLKQKSGVIVNVSSTPALSGHDRGFAFTVAKAGILGLTKALAYELAPNVRVNAVALGNVETGWIAELNPEELRRATGENLAKRLGTPAEVAKTLAFLCSDDSSFVNGQTIVLDGGSILH